MCEPEGEVTVEAGGRPGTGLRLALANAPTPGVGPQLDGIGVEDEDGMGAGWVGGERNGAGSPYALGDGGLDEPSWTVTMSTSPDV